MDMAQGQVAQAGGGDIRRGGRPISGAIGVAMQDHEMRPPVLRGVKARQGGQLPITKRGTGDGAVAQVQCFDLGRRENMHLAGPGIAPVRAVRPHGIMVARGDKNLRRAFGQGLAQLVDGIAIDCAGIKEIPGQQHQAAARPAAEAGEKLQQLAGLSAALGSLFWRQPGKGRIQMQVRRVQQLDRLNHRERPARRRGICRRLHQR